MENDYCVPYQIYDIIGIILCRLSGREKKMSWGIWVKGIWKQEKRGKREEVREEEEGEQHRCQGFPVQCTETRANTTIRMSGEIVK